MATIADGPDVKITKYAPGTTVQGAVPLAEIQDAVKITLQAYLPGKTVTVVQAGEGFETTVGG